MFDNDDFFLGYMMGSSEHDNYSSGGGDGSGIKAVLCVIGGLVLEAFFLMMCNAEISNIPAILLALGWMLCTAGLVFLVTIFSK